MSPERWGEIKTVFREALETPLVARSAFLERACGSDAGMREDLETLLAAAEGTSVPPIPASTFARALHDAGNTPLDSDVTTRAVLESALGGEYDLLRRIGTGGMGVVYLARETALRRDVAIKVLRPDLADFAPAARARFRREAQICASLEHPGIIPLHRYGEARGIWYFVMGYVCGETLADRLRHEGPVPSEETRRILLELADALEHAHAKHVVHRDIKSTNILLEGGDVRRPKLADFGISKVQGAADTFTPSSAMIGTPAYMSPEQLERSPDIDERSDIYSLGLVGYAMLVGHEPFADVDDVAAWRLHHDPPPLSEVAPSVPPGLATVITRCLMRDRASRWQDARSLKDALACVDGSAKQVLPAAVRDLPGYGQWALAWSIVFTALALVPNHPPRDIVLLLLLGALVPLGLVLHVWNVGRGGLSYGELAYVACWPPEWWGMWWPRMLRRPEDLWSRLPWQARLVRGTLSLLFVALPALILLGTRRGFESPWLDVVEYALVAGAATVSSGALLWARQQGLTFADAVRLLFGATMPSPAWEATHVARLVAPVRGVRPPNYSRPADFVRAMEDLIPLLPSDADIVGSDIPALARGLLKAVDASDREVAVLERHASPAELARLEAKLAELEGETSPHGSERRADLRELVKGQLTVAQRMRGDLEMAGQRRTYLFGLMRGLWLQLCRVHDAALGTAAEGPDPRLALRRLCGEIGDALEHQPLR